MNLVVRRRLAAGALLASSTLVAGVLLAPGATAAANGLSISPSAVVSTEAAKKLTFTGTDADFEYGGSATFTRIGGGQPFSATLDDPTVTGNPPIGKNTKGAATVNFVDQGDGVGLDGPADAGSYNVTATGKSSPVPDPVNPGGGTDTCQSCFTVLSPGPVAVTGSTPTSLRPGASGNLTVAGSNFERGTMVQFLFTDGSVDPLITANTAPKDSTGTDIVKGITTRTQIQRTAKVDAADAPGSRGIRVTNLDGTTASCTACFFVSGPPLTGLSPTGGPNDPGRAPLAVTFTGSNVVDGEPRLEFTGNPGSSTRNDLSLVGTKTAPSNGTSMTATFDLQNAAPGSYQGVIRDSSTGIVNACEQPACPAFTVVQSNRAPTLTGLDRDPNTAGNQHDQQAGTTQVFDVSGTNFSKGVTLAFAPATSITVTAVQFVSPTLVRATVVSAKDAATGDRDVTATLTDGSSSAACSKCYTVTATPSPSPSTSASSSGPPCPSSSASSSPSASVTPTASASSSASASPSSSASASPSASSSALPPVTCAPLSISVNPTDVTPGITSTVSVHGAPNSAVELYAYSRPSTTYTLVRSATTDARGDADFTPVRPGTNTRLYAHYKNGTAATDSPSKVIQVHTALSLSAYRDGVRKYHFQGTNLPRRPGQLITLYRLSGGQEIRTATVKTDSSGTWRINRTFTGNGTFTFVVRTSATNDNAAGRSNERVVAVH